MCGIIGIIGSKEHDIIETVNALSRLEYRGYDSSGVATLDGEVFKEIGYIKNLSESIPKKDTMVSIAHTRWATHGGVTKLNAHPHISDDIIIVHNGIIENFQALKVDLEGKGFVFQSQTDTETIAHFLKEKINEGLNLKSALMEFSKIAEGTYGVLAIQKNNKKIFALKKDSPLALGLVGGQFILASDIYAFSDKTNRAIFFEDNELAIIESESYTFYNDKGDEINKDISEFEISEGTADLGSYEHYMLKEIHEQPETSSRLISSFQNTQKELVAKFASIIKKNQKVLFISCGTSYHASLVGATLFNQLGYHSHCVVASEYDYYPFVDEETLVITLSQSGETMDVVTALKHAKKKGATIASVVNVPYSTIERMSEISMQTLAGPEICVASTKVFTNQLLSLMAVAKELGAEIDFDNISENIQKTLDENEPAVKALASKFQNSRDFFILGKGVMYPIAQEIALKLKEISYIHAEGMMAGELKHGTIALVEEGLPVMSLIYNKNPDVISSAKEVQARGAKTLMISNKELSSSDDNPYLLVPDGSRAEFAIYSTLIGHLLSYYIALENNLSIDKPRNLAKSVTVK